MRLSREVACLQLVPYHSYSFNLPRSLTNRLEATALIRAFVRDEVIPAAHLGERLLVVTRGRGDWSVAEHQNVIIYSGSETRQRISPINARRQADVGILAQPRRRRPKGKRRL